jgi:hypothetical protein
MPTHSLNDDMKLHHCTKQQRARIKAVRRITGLTDARFVKVAMLQFAERYGVGDDCIAIATRSKPTASADGA